MKKSRKNSNHKSSKTYKVECIKSHRQEGNKTFFLIKWFGFPDSDNTWEPEENLFCPELLQDYKTKNFSKTNQMIDYPKKENITSHRKDKKKSSYNYKCITEICGLAEDSKNDKLIYIVKIDGNNNLVRLPSSLLIKWAPIKFCIIILILIIKFFILFHSLNLLNSCTRHFYQQFHNHHTTQVFLYS